MIRFNAVHAGTGLKSTRKLSCPEFIIIRFPNILASCPEEILTFVTLTARPPCQHSIAKSVGWCPAQPTPERIEIPLTSEGSASSKYPSAGTIAL